MTRPVLHVVLRDVDLPPRRPDHPVRFWLWDTAGRTVMRTGTALHTAGLRMCGWAGTLDAIADGHR